MGVPIDQLTKDGYDSPFGVNVLGHFHLTTLLMPAILASPSPRIIVVSSIAQQLAPSEGIRFETLKGPKTATRIFGFQLLQRLQYYGQSKLVGSWDPCWCLLC